MNYLTTVLEKKWLTHDVFQLSIRKPDSFNYTLGQAVEVSLHKDKDILKAPFTITSSDKKDSDLQFIIKVYAEHHGITSHLAQLKINDAVSISEAWSSYKYCGPGIFIAAGSGITPFIPTLRLLKEQNKIDGHKLIFANKKAEDIILYEELNEIIGSQFYNVLSRDQLSGHSKGYVNIAYLNKIISDTQQHFYLCGPENFLKSVSNDLKALNVSENFIQIVN
ncbi:flavodoxin reductase [Pukyongia salina]|uniref:Flavodoxin reductase n=1 Tax=Pukyongia salina TaxID=2094025 RepID=A0A2S0HT12_9FLAO|nr:FAD-binding oxidoreductase [Pukyongia salina]AVI49724.1 flavodoxin reductase [Pukyongia salina]